jgi:hypothetical protein
MQEITKEMKKLEIVEKKAESIFGKDQTTVRRRRRQA